MREIKFRAIGKSTNTFQVGYLWLSAEKQCSVKTKEGWYCDCIPNTIGQFTGLKDHTGKDIYEGDFIKCIDPESLHFHQEEYHDYYEVRWDDRHNGWNAFPVQAVDDETAAEMIKQWGGEITWPDSNVLNNHWHFTVIGNVHQGVDKRYCR